MTEFENEVLRKLIRLETRVMKIAEYIGADVKEKEHGVRQMEDRKLVDYPSTLRFVRSRASWGL